MTFKWTTSIKGLKEEKKYRQIKFISVWRHYLFPFTCERKVRYLIVLFVSGFMFDITILAFLCLACCL